MRSGGVPRAIGNTIVLLTPVPMPSASACGSRATSAANGA